MRDSQAKLVLFNQLRRGPLSEVEASLFPVRLRADLVRDGVARKRDDGGLELVNATTYSETPATIPPPASSPPPAPVHESMTTLTVRVPREFVEMLDAMAGPGSTRSDVLRAILKRSAGSGLRKRTAGYILRERATS